jgi:hypothetical protein
MKQIAFNGALNKDIAPKFLKEGDYTGAKNIIFQTSKDGNAGILRLYPGFLQATGPALPVDSIEVGVYENRTKRVVYFFLQSTTGEDRICKYNPSTNTYENILVWNGLNFAFAPKITGIAMIGDYLFWTDFLNQPRYINVARSYTNLIESDITLIRPAPLFPLTYQIETAVSTYTPLTGNAYQFSHRYVYLDNQISVIAPYTDNIYCEDADNLITAIYLQKPANEELPKYLREIQLIVRRHDEDNWRIWKTVTPTEFAGDVTVEVLATQLAVPYVDANTLITANGEIVTWEFAGGTLVGPNIYSAGTQFNVRNYNIEASDPAGATPQLRVDIYRNGVIWQQLSRAVVVTGEVINFDFNGEAGTLYQIYSYSTEDGIPDASPFANSVRGFKFEGDRLGRAIPIQETVKPFESVPIKSKSLEVARDRVTLGWNIEGYDRYSIPSLRAIKEEIEVILSSRSLEVWIQEVEYFEEDYDNNVTFQSSTITYWLKDGDKYYYFKIGDYTTTTSMPGGGGDYTSPGTYTGSETTATVNQDVYKVLGDLVFSNSEGSIGAGSIYSTRDSTLTKVSPEHLVSVNLETANTVGSTKFKNKSQYQIGIVFYDRYLRNQGVYTNENCIVTIDDNYRAGTINSIRFELSLDDKLNIPIWADTYQIVRTDNLSRVSFLQGKTSDAYWVYEETGVIKYSRSYRADAEYIELDISGSFKAGVRYNFAEGDLIDLELATGISTYQIIGFLGSRVRIAPLAIPDLGTTVSPFPVRLYYEIFRPKQITEDLLFYEIGAVYPILGKGTGVRNFSITSAYLKGDVVVVEGEHFDYADARTVTSGAFADNVLVNTPVDIVIEALNIDNNTEVGWIKSLGRINAQLDIDQVERETAVRWSNRFIQGTRVNGTSSFEVNDEKQLPIEVGPIYKLQMASKQQQEGTVMLAICNPECVSLYLGETQFVDRVNQELIGATVEIIGSTNVLNGGAGTVNPETVIFHNGRVWWWDLYGSRVLRYDPNGIRDISELGMKSHFYNKISPVTGFDPFHNLFMIGFGGNMLSFDETFNQWRSEYEFSPVMCSKVEDYMISFKGGVPYRSNHTTLATYFDDPKTGIYEFYLADITPQELDNIAMFVTERFTWNTGRQIVADLFDITVTNESGQETSLIYSDFEVSESVLYAHFLRDINSLGGILTGDVMRSDLHKIKITIKGDIGFETLTINDSKSSGH